MSASSDSGPEFVTGPALQAATGRLPPADLTGKEVAVIEEIRTVAIAPTRKQLSTDMLLGIEQAAQRARQIAAMDTQNEQRELHLQTRTAVADKERDAALRESDRVSLLLKKMERERDQALQDAQRERESKEVALRELADLQGSHRRPLVADPGVLAGKAAMVTLVESCLTSRAAEALRRREVTRTLIGVAAREQVYRAVTSQQQQTCRCFTLTQDTLAAGTPLPDASSHPEIQVHVDRVLKSLTVRQAVNLDISPLGDYEIDEAGDRSLVQSACRPVSATRQPTELWRTACAWTP
eukprot:GHVU01173190.1.p1 GENE.GHVU01173190.1~~GHVU01173190.1.p1  ORF type:complete len:296 (-),score=31.57 GHVU01173190.1:122-1009(-)